MDIKALQSKIELDSYLIWMRFFFCNRITNRD